MSEKLYISWEKFHRDLKTLSEPFKNDDQWIGIIAITRGGLVPAGIFATETGIKNVKVIGLKSYEGDQQGEMSIINQPTLDNGGEGWIVIDDLSDTGKTLEVIKELYPNAKRICPYVKPEGKPLAHSFIEETTQDTWIVFPWDQ